MQNLEKDPNSSINQEIKRRFVASHVYYCVSSLINHLVNLPSECFQSSGEVWEDVLEICQAYDWEETALSFISYEMGRSEILEALEKYGVDPQEAIVNGRDPKSSLFEAIGNYQDFCNDFNLDPVIIEAYEHWLVSDWLACQLKEYGEMVAQDLFGLTVWGRRTTEQPILLDEVISQVCSDMEILDGQKYSWAPREKVMS